MTHIYKFISTPPPPHFLDHPSPTPQKFQLGLHSIPPKKSKLFYTSPPKKWYLMSPPFFIPPPPPLGAHTLIQKMHLFPQILVREGAKNTLQGEGGAVFRGLRPFISIPPAFFSYLSPPPTFFGFHLPPFYPKKVLTPPFFWKKFSPHKKGKK